jgi:hypothetical protein
MGIIARRLGVSLGIIAGLANAQINISAGGESVRIDAGGGVSVQSGGHNVKTMPGGDVSVGTGNQARSTTGQIEPGANIEGVTIINGKLWIDGKEIPPGVKRYKSPKTGTVYKIERNGKNVSVTSEE